MSDEDIQTETTPLAPAAPSPLDIRQWALRELEGEDPRPAVAMAYALIYIGDILTTSMTSAIYDLADQIRGR